MKFKCNEKQCKTCPFKQENYSMLSGGRWEEIYGYLLKGVNHLCHSTNDTTVCRGGRDWQLTIFHRMGFIREATDTALEMEMKRVLGDCDKSK